jgi:protein-S-isoprenylcysteine O-methyltransferase Ste14
MHLLVLTWPYAVIFWVVFAWAFVPEQVVMRNEGWTTPQDANSKRALVLSQVFGMVAAIAIASTVPLGALPHPMLFFWIGIAALIAGRLLRRHCHRMLGSSFTGAVIVNADHAVVEKGAYRYVRHPSYTAAVILFLGIGFALANWISLATLTALVSITFLYRVTIEERALVAVIGDPYRNYMQRTKRFVPFLF